MNNMAGHSVQLRMDLGQRRNRGCTTSSEHHHSILPLKYHHQYANELNVVSIEWQKCVCGCVCIIIGINNVHAWSVQPVNTYAVSLLARSFHT
jgi:hypothetical protein